ncbi:hypothetical protein LTR47_006104 [Exophiala xenobiotica]|nr:hypothetical protein LTR47_006104 [Exophiala xenobiotica]KAK5255385.1 hypothetical protein LTS06_000406 [Exophiala xenobiotica]KAK5348611.1 hypothetical protein LTR61_007638 [Exophiala xenobiotica]KAK5366853.1 hypothetical protein LTR11_008021 [Exophiala xenobiotica]KAK5368078.1 hypothetical protein LTS03_008222 [Exophiala xenobiotica]
MNQLKKKTLDVKRSLTYTYYISDKTDANSSKPVLFFIHGFPDSAHMWSDVIDRLSVLPYRILAIDTLGYAGSSKPTDTALYSWSDVTNDCLEILDAEDIKKTILIGHDWGSSLAQRLYLHHPDHVSGIVILCVSYRPPTYKRYDLDAANAQAEQTFGYTSFAYWELFTATDGAKIINENLEKFWEVLHGDVDDWMKKMFCVRGAMRAYLLDDEHVPLKPYAKDPKWKNELMERYQRDGFEAPVQYYKAVANNIQSESDMSIPKERLKLQVPVCYVGCTGDAVCRTDLNDSPKAAGLMPDLEEHVIESAHWVAQEKPEEVAKIIKDFVTKRFS